MGLSRAGRPLVYSGEELRRMLRRPRRETPDVAAAGAAPERPPLVARRDRPRPARPAPPPARRRAPDGPPVRLEEAVAGREVEGPLGRYYRVDTPAASVEGASRAVAAFEAQFLDERSALRRCLGTCPGAAGAGPDDLLFLDLETAGLSQTPLFLAGAMLRERGGLVVRQYLARTYAEEAPMLADVLARLQAARVVVTFNGKSFDLPFVRMRAVLHRLPFRWDGPHLDLLYPARRAWRGDLPDCRLQTLERHVCGRVREDDLPGAEIPEAYHAFVRTGDARDLVGILRHNLLDLVTLADLLTRMP